MSEYRVRDVETGLLDAIEGDGLRDGDVIQIHGRAMRIEGETWSSFNARARKEGRDVGLPQIKVAPNFDNVVGYTMPNDHPSIDNLGIKRNDDGHPVFTSREQIRKFNADSRRQNERDPSVPAYGWDGAKE